MQQVTKANSRGRPRKAGDREPSGRLQRPSKAVISTHRDAAIIARERLNPMYGSPLGCMLLADKISRKEFEAGCAYKSMRQDMDRLLGLPCRSPRALDLHGIKGISLAAGRDDKAEERFRRKFEAIESLLGEKRAGGKWWVVDQLVIHEIPLVGHEQFLTLRTALAAIGGFLEPRP